MAQAAVTACSVVLIVDDQEAMAGHSLLGAFARQVHLDAEQLARMTARCAASRYSVKSVTAA